MTDAPLDRMGADGFIAERATFYAVLYAKLREAARLHGYALTLHGSLVKDLDVVAVPWVEDAAAPDVLTRAIVDAAGGMVPPGKHVTTTKPHGRACVTIFLGGTGGYIDLSITPRQPCVEDERTKVDDVAVARFIHGDGTDWPPPCSVCGPNFIGRCPHLPERRHG
jgi:hypothetical protein